MLQRKTGMKASSLEFKASSCVFIVPNRRLRASSLCLSHTHTPTQTHAYQLHYCFQWILCEPAVYLPHSYVPGWTLRSSSPHFFHVWPLWASKLNVTPPVQPDRAGDWMFECLTRTTNSANTHPEPIKKWYWKAGQESCIKQYTWMNPIYYMYIYLGIMNFQCRNQIRGNGLICSLYRGMFKVDSLFLDGARFSPSV